MYWRKIRKTNRKFTTHERSVSVWKWMNDPNSVAAPRKLNPRFDGCFPFLPHSPSPSVFVLILPCDNITESPSCGKGSERSYFYPSDTLQNMHKQTGLRQHARAHTQTQKPSKQCSRNALHPARLFSLGKPIAAVLCSSYITQSPSEVKWVRSEPTLRAENK